MSVGHCASWMGDERCMRFSNALAPHPKINRGAQRRGLGFLVRLHDRKLAQAENAPRRAVFAAVFLQFFLESPFPFSDSNPIMKNYPKPASSVWGIQAVSCWECISP